MDSVPVVAIAGNVTRDLLGLDSFQEVDITGITMPITKAQLYCQGYRDLASILREAFQIANSGRWDRCWSIFPRYYSPDLHHEKQPLLQPTECDLPPQERFSIVGAGAVETGRAALVYRARAVLSEARMLLVGVCSAGCARFV